MSPTSSNKAADVPSLRPSRYDRVASLLISMLILSGASVAMLFVLWLGTQRDLQGIIKCKFDFADEHGESQPSGSEELDTPQLAELSDAPLLEPFAELSMLLNSDAVAVAAQLGIDAITVERRGKTNGRIAGPRATETVPRWARWEIRYEASSLENYAKQLDYFGIELGAAGGKRQVDYASKLATAKPVVRTGPGSDETRLYLTWRGGRLEALDRTLLQQAGIDVNGRIVLQFYPQEIDDMLARLESEHTQDGRVDKLRKTIFGVRTTDDAYEFFIIEQR